MPEMVGGGMVRVIVAAWLAVVSGGGALAQANPAPPEAAPYERSEAHDIVIGEKGLWEWTERYETRLLSEAAVQQFGTHQFRVNEYFQDLAILSAATVKPDGSRIPVTPDRILVQAAPGASEALHFHADVKIRTVIFPGVATGDRVEVTARFRQKRPQHANGNSFGRIFLSNARRSGAVVTVTAPKAMKLHLFAEGLDRKSEDRGRQARHVFTLGPKPVQRSEPSAVSPLDRDPRVLVSTFADWNAVGRTFYDHGAPKAKPNPEIRKLAESITAGKTDRREQAEAIFNWVATNIRYVNIVLGTGGWVPRDASAVLAHRYGDCKDHVTLMRALLDARGIPADYALVNGASVYQPYPLPMAWWDHIVLYLPEFGLYADPTAGTSRLGVLPSNLADKPVLRINAAGSRLMRTPKIEAAENRIHLRAEVTLKSDGSATGTSTMQGSGPAAASVRGLAGAISREGVDLATRHLLQQGGSGTATYEPRSPSDRSDPYALRASFSLSDLGASFRVPTGPRVVGRPGGTLATAIREKWRQPFGCYPVTYVEDLTIRLPEGRMLRRNPDSLVVQNAAARYEAKYVLSAESLQVTRSFEWRNDGSVCDPARVADADPVLRAFARDVETNLALDPAPARAASQ